MTVPRSALENIRSAIDLTRRAPAAPAAPVTTAPPAPSESPATGPLGIPLPGSGAAGGPLGGLFGGLVATPPAPVEPPPPPPPPPAPSLIRPGLLNPALVGRLGDLVIPPRPPVEAPLGRRTFTDLASDAIARLRAAPRDLLAEAVRTLQAKGIAAPMLLNWIERKTRIGEVLATPAGQWSADTVTDFAGAFQMDASRLATMDLIVAIAILNERELEEELRAENMPDVTAEDLLQNRRVVYQYPPPGTELQPPYVILVAVEHQDLQRAADAVAAILGQLVDAQGFRMPRDAAARLG